MRVLHITPAYFPAYRYGGPIESVHALNKYLVRAGARVEVFTTAIDGPGNLDVAADVPVDVDGVKVNYFTPNFPRAWFYSRNLARALKARMSEFEIVHITSVFLAASALGARAARAAGKPYLISPRGSLMLAPLAKSALKKKLYLDLVEKKNLAGAAAIHFTTDLESREYKEAGLPLPRGIIIPNGLDPESLVEGDPRRFRQKYNLKPDERMVLFLSRLSWKKGLDTLIEACGGLVKELPATKLVIAGGDDENYRSKINEFIAAAKIKNKVIFTGELHGEDKVSAYQAADVFCLPSYAENFGGVVLEAMYYGVPVVVTPEVGVAPAVSEAEAGFVVKKSDLEVKFALHKILTNSKLARTLGGHGRELVAQKFSYAAVAQEMLSIYNRLIQRHD